MQEYVYGVNPHHRNRLSVERCAVTKVTAKTVMVEKPNYATSFRHRIPIQEVSWSVGEAVASWRNQHNKKITEHANQISKLRAQLEFPVENAWETE